MPLLAVRLFPFLVVRARRQHGNVWTIYSALTNVFCRLMSMPERVEDKCMAVVERCDVMLYDLMSAMVKVNQARKDLFSKKAGNLEDFQPSRVALEQHTMRAIFQGAYM